jgi:hypothetical protein
LIVELCVDIIEARGLDHEGIYRKPGSIVEIKALSDYLNHGFDGLNPSDPRFDNVDVISSIQKSKPQNQPAISYQMGV